MLRHREDLIFYDAKCPLAGMEQLLFWGAEVLPPFLGLILNFLRYVNKYKEIRVDEGVGGGNGVVDGFERYLGIKTDCSEYVGGGEGISGLVHRFILSNKMADGAIL